MKKRTVAAACMFIVLMAAPSLFAGDDFSGTREQQGPGGFDGRGHMMWHERFYGGRENLPQSFSELNLTDRQKNKIMELRKGHLKDVEPLRDEMIKKRDKLRQLWLQPDPEREEILALRKDIGELRERLSGKMRAHRTELLNVLTKEQQDRAKEMFSEHYPGGGPGRGGERPGRGMMGPRGGVKGY